MKVEQQKSELFSSLMTTGTFNSNEKSFIAKCIQIQMINILAIKHDLTANITREKVAVQTGGKTCV